MNEIGEGKGTGIYFTYNPPPLFLENNICTVCDLWDLLVNPHVSLPYLTAGTGT